MDCGFTNKEGWFRYRAAAIIIEDNHVLAVKNDKEPYYYSVGGGVHLHETAEEAVIREVKEETGVEYEIERLAFIHQNFFKASFSSFFCDLTGGDKELKCHELAFYFLMKPHGTKQLGESLSYGTNGGKEQMVWLPINKLNDYFVYPTFYKDKLHDREKLFDKNSCVEIIVSHEY